MIIDYAKQKLLDGPSVLRSENRSGSLACLSVRFALEFNMDGTARDVTYAQVERHMRLCIAATAGLEKMITIPGSEPLLSEAAYELMKHTQTNAVRHLADHSDLNCIDRGRRGELVAVLLIMQAYDAARSMSLVGGRRWVSVVDFMEALLPASEYETLRQSGPTFWRTHEEKEMTFEGVFKEYGTWFNHVIKIEDRRMVSIDHLWKFVTRGAMIMCATNQEGIDIVLPVCQTTRNLGPDSVTAIIVQVKNAICGHVCHILHASRDRGNHEDSDAREGDSEAGHPTCVRVGISRACGSFPGTGGSQAPSGWVHYVRYLACGPLGANVQADRRRFGAV